MLHVDSCAELSTVVARIKLLVDEDVKIRRSLKYTKNSLVCAYFIRRSSSLRMCNEKKGRGLIIRCNEMKLDLLTCPARENIKKEKECSRESSEVN